MLKNICEILDIIISKDCFLFLMDYGDGINIEDVVIPEFDKFIELDPQIKGFETEIKRRWVVITIY